jgi:putative ABC transport system permease protein
MHQYLLLKERVDPVQFSEQIWDFPMRKAGDMFNQWGFKGYLKIAAIKDIYLKSDRGNNLGPSSRIKKIYFLLLIAGPLLITGCLNFINLSTARSMERAKEVGLRKVVGSTRDGLIRQFLTESMLVCFTALIIAVLVMILILPLFNNLTGKMYVTQDLFRFNTVLFFIALTAVVAVLAGLYPSFVLSRFKPVDVLQGKFSTGRRGVLLRKTMVAFQFVVTTALIFCTLIVHDQLSYMLNSNPGFNKDQVIVMDSARIPISQLAARKDIIKQALLEHPFIQSVSTTRAVPGNTGWNGQVCYPEGMPEGDMLSVEFIPVDHDYVKTFELQIVAGRDFSTEMLTDKDNALLINETSVKAMGWGTPENAIGKMIDSPSGYPRGMVIGVFKDYNHHSFKEGVRSIVLDVLNNYNGVIALKVSANNFQNALGVMEEEWNNIFPGYPFSYFFLDEFYDRQYKEEIRLSNIFGSFAVLATSQRTKEIGIRKVLGASAAGISVNLIQDYLKLITGAFIVSIPVAYILMDRWLTDFAYRINIGIGTILISTMLTAVLAVLTVSYRAIKAASANPVDSMRYE